MSTSYKHPKLFIIGYFDDLVRYVEIEAEEILQKYTKPDPKLRVIYHNYAHELLHIDPENTYGVESYKDSFPKGEELLYFQRISFPKDIQIENLKKHIPGQTKVIDYINDVRMRIIDLLKKEQEDLLRYFDANRSLFKYDRNEMSEGQLEELKIQLFANRFHFFVKVYLQTPVFNKILIISDIYFNKSEMKEIE